MMTMKVLRELAIFRHRVVWAFNGSHPEAWPVHMFWIKAVYGY